MQFGYVCPAVMTKRILFLLVSMSVPVWPCLGNVGESDTAVNERYGKSFGEIPTNTFGIVNGYIAGGYVVGVKFIDGVSEMEMFSKGNQADMGASEIDRLLKKNSPGDWKAELTGKPNWRRWRRDDGTVVALYDAARHFLYINSKSFYELKGVQIEQQEWNQNNLAPSPQVGTGTTGISAITPAPAGSASPAASPSP